MDTRHVTIEHADHTDEYATRRYQRRRGVHDLPRRERQGGRRQQVRAAVNARV